MGDKPEPVTLYKSNFRETVATLRQLADEIERGEHGDVEAIGLVMLAGKLRTFGMGPKSDPPMIALMLHAGCELLSRPLLEGPGG